MSEFTNPPTSSPEEIRSYVDAILGLLGDSDPIQVLRATPGELRLLVGGRSPEALSAPEAPGKWSAGEVVAHLADSELVWGFRLRMVLAHDRPRLAGYDQDAWAARLGYAEADLDRALETFTVLRAGNLDLLERSGPEALERTSLHEERGEESLGHMIRLYAGHDLVHLGQVQRALDRSRPPHEAGG